MVKEHKDPQLSDHVLSSPSKTEVWQNSSQGTWSTVVDGAAEKCLIPDWLVEQPTWGVLASQIVFI